MSGGTGERGVLLLVESNTSGTGRLFVHAARDLGFRPVLLTARPEKYAFLAGPDAPEVVPADTAVEDELYALVRRRFGAEVAGITSSSEYFIATAAALAARLALPGPDAAAVRAARDKSWQRRALAAGGVAVPAFRTAASAAQAAAAARDIGFPVVLKPVDGSGSAGVRACADAGEAEAHAALLFASGAADTRVLVESLVTGPEFSVEMFSGRVVGITRKHLGSPPWFVEGGHDYPAALPPGTARALTEAAVRGTSLLGLGWGPLHWELRVDGAGRAVPMEVNPRLAGGFIPELVRHAQGIDLIRATLCLVAGQAPDLAARRNRHASIRFLFSPAAGRLEGVDGLDEARAAGGVVDVAVYRAPGDALQVHGDFRDRIGHVVACADGDGAAAAAERGRDALRVRVARAAGVLRGAA